MPSIEFPYVSEIEYLQKVENRDGKAVKTRFKDDRVTSPFYFLLKIKELENEGIMKVTFYYTEEITNKTKRGQAKKDEPVRIASKRFRFGEQGKYYEYILFFDRVEGLKPGMYRYAVFFNDRLLYDGSLKVNEPLPFN